MRLQNIFTFMIRLYTITSTCAKFPFESSILGILIFRDRAKDKEKYRDRDKIVKEKDIPVKVNHTQPDNNDSDDNCAMTVFLRSW